MLRTPFTDLVGCAVPVQSAPITSRTDFLAAVASTGALPMMATGTEPPPADELLRHIDTVRQVIPRPFGVNFLGPFLEEGILAEIAPKVRVVELFFAHPDPDMVGIIHEGAALASWQVGSLEEAVAAEEAGCDFIVVQGVEAGGHVRATIGLLPLLSEILPAVRCPLIAAGTIATGADLAAAMTAGASGVRIGTRLVASCESLAHPAYKQALIEAGIEDTVLTEAFDREWPNAPHRVLRSCLEAAERIEDEVVAENVLGEARMPVHRFSTAPPSIYSEGAIEAMALYAGKSVVGIDQVRSVADIITGLCEEAERALSAGN